VNFLVDASCPFGSRGATSPQRLLVVATGNITNTALLSLFETHLDVIATALGDADFVELGPSSFTARPCAAPRAPARGARR